MSSHTKTYAATGQLKHLYWSRGLHLEAYTIQVTEAAPRVAVQWRCSAPRQHQPCSICSVPASSAGVRTAAAANAAAAACSADGSCCIPPQGCTAAGQPCWPQLHQTVLGICSIRGYPFRHILPCSASKSGNRT